MPGIVFGVAAPGQTGYFQIMDVATGQVANGAALEVWNPAHWANYVVAAGEQAGSGRYTAGFPGYLPAGRYLCELFIQGGGSPVSGDTPVDDKVIDWDGANVIGLSSSLNMGKINGSASAAVALATAAAQYVIGAAAAGTLTTAQMTTNLVASQADVYTGRIVLFTSGANVGRAAVITAYAVTGGKLTFVAYGSQPIGAAPQAGDTFLIL